MNKNYRKLIIRMLEDIGDGKIPKYNNYDISKECFGSILNYIKSKDFARGLCIVRRSKVNNVKAVGCMNPYLTNRGVTYLNKNAKK